MNFLAHLHLSGTDPDIMAGNFLGDFTRTKLMKEYPPEMKQGVHLHRAIDEFTDSHPDVKSALKLLRPRQQKYAPVALDILFDHFLAKNWSRYHDQPLNEFSVHCYQTLEEYREYFTPKAERFFRYLRTGDILTAYSEPEGIEYVFHGMSRRADFSNNLHAAPLLLSEKHDALSRHFHSFYPELINHAARFKKKLHES